MTGYWYLATAYTKYPDGPTCAFVEACRAAAHLIRAGLTVYSPIAHGHMIAAHGQIDPLDHALWMACDKPMMESAAGLIVCMMPGWQESVGIAQEIAEFIMAGKPILYLDWHVNEGAPARPKSIE